MGDYKTIYCKKKDGKLSCDFNNGKQETREINSISMWMDGEHEVNMRSGGDTINYAAGDGIINCHQDGGKDISCTFISN